MGVAAMPSCRARGLRRPGLGLGGAGPRLVALASPGCHSFDARLSFLEALAILGRVAPHLASTQHQWMHDPHAQAETCYAPALRDRHLATYA